MPSAFAQPVEVEFKLSGTNCTLQTGRIARQASGAVLARSGESVILATVVVAPEARPDASFFPLTVEYREKFAAAGQIPGAYNRREGRISDHEVLMSRLIDRTVRSLFPDNFKNEVQIQVTVMSADPSQDPSTLALLAACAAVHISPAPAAGPAAGLRLVRVDGALSAFPSHDKRTKAELDFVVSAGPTGLVMVEGGGDEIPEAECAEALQQALEWLQRMHKVIGELRDKAGKDKLEAVPPPELPEVDADTRNAAREVMRNAQGKKQREAAFAEWKEQQLEPLTAKLEAGEIDEDQFAAHAQSLSKLRVSAVRSLILDDGHRPDGRGGNDIRPIWCEVGFLPRAHGSSVFTRGETQSIASCTLGTPEDAQRIQTLQGDHRDGFLLHYNFPPYSVNEARPLRGPGRREIGHGALAKRGLVPLLPDDDDFPYTIRLESEITESNGSSSMATVCSGSLAMLHAGVPLRRPAAGIAMGLISEGDKTAILSDIVGEEDHLGDMDFKVVGTEVGVTALQLDNKIGGLSFELLRDALNQARKGRLHILAEMAKVLAKPNEDMPKHAPRVHQTAILPDSIGALVGPRGANIREIQSSTGARVSVDDHGVVLIYAADGPSAKSALQQVHRRVGVVRAGHFYNGTITGVKQFGSFVRVNEVTEGLVPKHEMVGDSPGEGEPVVVKVLGADERGRLQLSMKAAQGVDTALIDW